MFSIEYNTIALEWHGTPPFDRKRVERIVRTDIRRHILPMKPIDLTGYFIPLTAMAAIVYVFGEEGSDAFHCIYFQ